MVNGERTAIQKLAGAETAKMLLDIKAINFRPKEPYILTSGWASPVYIDCRWVISFVEERRRIISLSADLLRSSVDVDNVDIIAGGETAGIPFAAWLSDELSKPMVYVRKKPKGFGRNSQIEGNMSKGNNVLLVEDLATDGGSKILFIDALRADEAQVKDIFVIFYYDSFPGAEEAMSKAGIRLHYLANWWDVLVEAEKGKYFSENDLQDVRDFLADPCDWSASHGGK